jgi:hypothetical protein
MYKPLEAFIGLRYLRAKRRNHFISFISLISMLGIALGVTTLITALSVMNGFEKELRARILGAIAHATIAPVNGAMMDWRSVIDQVEKHPEVNGAAPFIEEGVWLQGTESSGAFIRGVQPDYESRVSEVDQKMLSGQLSDLRPGQYGIILGLGLANRLQVQADATGRSRRHPQQARCIFDMDQRERGIIFELAKLERPKHRETAHQGTGADRRSLQPGRNHGDFVTRPHLQAIGQAQTQNDAVLSRPEIR